MTHFLRIVVFLALISSSKADDPWTEIYTSKPPISRPSPTPTPPPVTPTTRYYKSVKDAIGSRFYYYLSDHLDDLKFPLSAKLKLKIDSSGKLLSISVDPTKISSKLFYQLLVKATTEADIPPFSKELKDEVGDSISFILGFEQK